MSGNIRLPNITGKTVEEQALQMKSYLTQLAGELNWALENVAGGTGTGGSAYIPYRSANQGGSAVNTQQRAEEILRNFNDLKGLIIKSADIVNAYYEEINTRLEGLYVAQSEYDTFVKQTNATITKNSTGISQNYENLQLVTGRVEKAEGDIDNTKAVLGQNIANTENNLAANINAAKSNLADDINKATKDLNDSIASTEKTLGEQISGAKDELEVSIEEAEKRLQDRLNSVADILVAVQAYIRSGLLYYDETTGIPIYGVEVGQTNEVNGQQIYSKYARFTSDRLSFYDQNDQEVAYISNRKLYIKHVEITVSLTMGGFVDTVMADRSIVTKWVGGVS